MRFQHQEHYVRKTKKVFADPQFHLQRDLDCFLRHIRNAIAHGRVYYNHAGNRVHIVFEDENITPELEHRKSGSTVPSSKGMISKLPKLLCIDFEQSVSMQISFFDASSFPLGIRC